MVAVSYKEEVITDETLVFVRTLFASLLAGLLILFTAFLFTGIIQSRPITVQTNQGNKS